MKIFFHTLGCKVNQYESEYIKGIFVSSGYIEASDPKAADIIIVNSCTVTAESDRKTRQLVRRYRRLKPEAVIVLTGCMPQAFPTQAEALPADIILGNESSRNVLKATERFLSDRQRIINIPPHLKGERFESCRLESFSERTRAYIKIEDGCDRGCTYCIIPKARGRVRSRSLEDIKAEALSLAKKGFKELVLVGINLSSYGKENGLSLADAVEVVSKIEGISRVRLGSLEPDLTTPDLLDRLQKIPQFCPQFHLSLQSGCDATLKRMNRLYSTNEYKTLVDEIRKRWENPGVTTDIMVGFIGESEEEFNASLSFTEEIGFLKAHIFPYSVREGTAAALMKGRIDEQIKHIRAAKMAKACDLSSKRIMEKMVGTNCKVLFETMEKGYLMGYSESYAPVYVKGDKALLHTEKEVTLTDLINDGLLGIIE
ncbi:MAG: tRNA (N(6)-L-threonylcarbamoyladenosine(37)-C(2))-methylthiotransferase MtaB [Clostridia bacterium]|nr:tRNA (N(6)-L-threonylcarbamoyladenosine(37)-C(2))-methylthiotransferase MtaB [Clostridia bacterium]